MGCGFFSLLLRGKSGATLLPSGLEQLLVQTVLGRLSVMEVFGRISSSTCLFVAPLALGNLDFDLRLRIFQSFGVWVLLVENVVFLGRVRCLIPQWIHVL